MAISAEELYRQYLELNEQGQNELVDLILANLEPVDSDVEEAWLKEVEKRLIETESGTVKLVSWEQIRAKLSRKLDASTTD